MGMEVNVMDCVPTGWNIFELSKYLIVICNLRNVPDVPVFQSFSI